MVEHVVSYNNWCRITAANATRCGRRSSARLARHWTAHIDTTATTAEADVIGGHAKHVMVPFQREGVGVAVSAFVKHAARAAIVSHIGFARLSPDAPISFQLVNGAPRDVSPFSTGCASRPPSAERPAGALERHQRGSVREAVEDNDQAFNTYACQHI